MNETVQYTKDGHIATITLNRPVVHNAINLLMRDGLYEALEAVRDDPDVRVAVVTGAGSSFCSGADLSEFGTGPSAAVARTIRGQRDLWALLAGLAKPLVAAIQGYAVAGGLELALFCDVRVAAADSRLGFPEVQWGLLPNGGGTQTLARVCGLGHAQWLLLTGELIPAERAQEIGLVHLLAPVGESLSTARSVAERLAGWNPLVTHSLKEALRASYDLPLDSGLRLETLLSEQIRRESGGETSGE